MSDINATTCSFENYVKYTMILLLKVCKVNGFMQKIYEMFIKSDIDRLDMRKWVSLPRSPESPDNQSRSHR